MIMNLHDKLLQKHNENVIKSFQKTYPEVYEWFQGESFEQTITKASSVSIRAYKILRDPLRKEYSTGLPIKDSNGIVDLDDIVEYLKAEGFVAYIGSEYVDTKDLMIRFSK
jgi:hypothetical protein